MLIFHVSMAEKVRLCTYAIKTKITLIVQARLRRLLTAVYATFVCVFVFPSGKDVFVLP